MNDEVHVFAGTFASREEACAYTEAQWEPEPDKNVSDADYAAWEERNPTWGMRQDLGVYLDSDFIETIDCEDRYGYLEGLLGGRAFISAIKKKVPPEANVLVLIFKEALGGFPAELKSTPRLTYCGAYACKR